MSNPFCHNYLSPMAGTAMLVFFFSFPNAALAQSDTLEVRFLAVGQADAALIRCPNGYGYVLIDAADTRYPGSSKAFRAFMTKEFEGKPRAIGTVIASHAHADHIGSMRWILENFDVSTYIDNGDKPESDTWNKLDKLRKKQVRGGALEYINAKAARTAEMQPCGDSNVTLHIFSPWAFSKKLTDPNDRSLIARLDHGSISFLFMGDAHDTAEEVMLEGMGDDIRALLDVDVLKVGHHGSDTSSTPAFIMATSPQLAIISSGEKEVGTNSGYKHPRSNTILNYTNWFKTADKTLYGSVELPAGKIWAYDSEAENWRQYARPKGLWLTTKDGTVLVRSNGTTVDVETQ